MGGAQVASAAISELVNFSTFPLCNCSSSLPYQDTSSLGTRTDGVVAAHGVNSSFKTQKQNKTKLLTNLNMPISIQQPECN